MLNMVLGNGDIVSVPQAERFFVYGYVKKPGAFKLPSEASEKIKPERIWKGRPKTAGQE